MLKCFLPKAFSLHADYHWYPFTLAFDNKSTSGTHTELLLFLYLHFLPIRISLFRAPLPFPLTWAIFSVLLNLWLTKSSHLLLKGTRARDFIVRFSQLFWHHSIIDKAEAQNFKNFVKISVKSELPNFREYRVIAENAPFHSAFSAKMLRFTPRIRRKRIVSLLLWIRCTLPKAHSFLRIFLDND